MRTITHDKSTKQFFSEFLKTVAPKDIRRVKRWLKLVRKFGDDAPEITYEIR